MREKDWQALNEVVSVAEVALKNNPGCFGVNAQAIKDAREFLSEEPRKRAKAYLPYRHPHNAN